MAQPGQPVQGNSNPFNWKRLIIALIILAGIVLIAVWIFGGFDAAPNVKSFTEFKTWVKNAKSGSEVHVFEASNYFTFKDHNGADQTVYGITSFHDFYHGGTWQPIGSAGNPPAPTSDIKVTFEAVHKSIMSSIWPVLSMFLPILLLGGLLVWMAKKQGTMGGGLGSSSNPAQKINSNKRFSDIAGQAEVKEEVTEVVDFLKNPKKYKVAGARIPRGIMLGGPPGTGKTLIAKATAGEAGVPFYFVSGSNFVEMFAGMGAKRVRTLFSEARKNAPAIIFIDEMDAIGRKRGSSLSGNDEREQTLNQILVEMDGMTENEGLLILAATNRPDVLDPALLRPGRFDRTITVNNPDIKEREAILRLHAKGKRISKEVDFANVAKRIPGYSGAQLENVINEAALLSVREETGVITLEQIDEAIDRVAAGPAKKHRVITPEELKMVAYHEAGHAVIGLKVSASQVVQKITIIPRGDAGGYNLMTPKKETFNYKKSDLEAMVMSYMGGRSAEQIIYGAGEVSTGASNDIERATGIARAMVTQYGMSSLGPIAYEKAQGSQFLGYDQNRKDYSESMSERIDEAVRELIMNAEKKAIQVIKKNKLLLDLIAEELLSKETIVKEEIDYINKHLKRPPVKKVKKVTTKKKELKDIINDVKAEKKSEKAKVLKTDKNDSKIKDSKSKKDN